MVVVDTVMAKTKNPFHLGWVPVCFHVRSIFVSTLKPLHKLMPPPKQLDKQLNRASLDFSQPKKSSSPRSNSTKMPSCSSKPGATNLRPCYSSSKLD